MAGKDNRLRVRGGYYEIADGQIATVSFAVTGIAMRHSTVNLLGAAHRRYHLPEGYDALDVDEEWRDDILYVRVRGARSGGYRFVPEVTNA